MTAGSYLPHSSTESTLLRSLALLLLLKSGLLIFGNSGVKCVEVGGRILVEVRIDGSGSSDTVVAIFRTGKVVNRKGARSDPSNFTFNTKQVLADFDAALI